MKWFEIEFRTEERIIELKKLLKEDRVKYKVTWKSSLVVNKALRKLAIESQGRIYGREESQIKS